MHFLSATTVYDVNVPAAAGDYWNGRFDVGAELRPLDQQTADIGNWREIMDHYGKSDDPRDTFSQAGYLTARIATETLLKLDPAKIDRAAVSEALRGVNGFKTDLLCSPWYFGPGDAHIPNHAGPIVSIVDGNWVSRADCVESQDPDLAPIREIEKTLGMSK
jgi:branched-chain amino acid transport system substrate-binding protein